MASESLLQNRPRNEEKSETQQVESLWKVADVATYLRLPPETVRMMARRGELPSIKVGKRLWRFRTQDIMQWLEAKLTAPDIKRVN